MKTSVEDRIIQRLQGFKEALQSGAVDGNRFTCRTIELDLKPQPYNPEAVKKTRKLLGASQAVFARFLGVSTKTVQAWEHGSNSPSDMACRFLDEICHNPAYWLRRLKEMIVTK